MQESKEVKRNGYVNLAKCKKLAIFYSVQTLASACDKNLQIAQGSICKAQRTSCRYIKMKPAHKRAVEVY